LAATWRLASGSPFPQAIGLSVSGEKILDLTFSLLSTTGRVFCLAFIWRSCLMSATSPVPSAPPESASETAKTSYFSRKQIIAGVIFLGFALYLATVVPSIQIAWVIGLLVLTIYLFAFEIVGVDVAAVTIMVLLGLSSLLAPIMGLSTGLVDSQQLFDGFSSNAVMSIIAVMIIGAGLDKTGLMSTVATFILKVGGTTEKRIIPIISGTVGIISSFMQNVGAAALFLPVVSRISSRSGIPMSRLLMPMGFTAILGGTVTMVGSSPLILLNDLILTSNQALPADQQMEVWSLFSVTPAASYCRSPRSTRARPPIQCSIFARSTISTTRCMKSSCPMTAN
jgi:di/tricarboxylate transporter